MKYLTILILSCWVMLAAQITSEQTYSGTLYNVKLKNGDLKNLMINYTTNTLSLYNTDHSLYKTVKVPVPTGYSIYYINIVADKLFDNDDQIEAAVTYSKTDTTGTYYIGRVIEESGTILLEVTDCYSFTAIGQANSYKLHCFQAALINGYYTYSTKVYGVPGSIAAVNPEESQRYNISAMNYPNPANGAVCVNYSLPQLAQTGDLNLYNSNGQLLSVHRLQGNQGSYLLKTENLASGVYFYQINAGLTTGKFNKLTLLK